LLPLVLLDRIGTASDRQSAHVILSECTVQLPYATNFFYQFSYFSSLLARKHICLARYMCLSVRPSVCHMGGSVKNGWN